MNRGQITPPREPLSYEEIVAELTRLLYGTTEPTQEQCDAGATLTITHDQLKELSGWKQFGFHFWLTLQWCTEDSWIIIGYGGVETKQQAILIGANSNYAPLQ